MLIQERLSRIVEFGLLRTGSLTLRWPKLHTVENETILSNKAYIFIRRGKNMAVSDS